MSKKKVIIVGPAFPFRGGIANFNTALAQAYQDRGDEVIIYSFTLQYPSFLFPGTNCPGTGAISGTGDFLTGQNEGYMLSFSLR